MMNLFRTSWLGYWRLGAEAHTPNLIPKYAKCRFRVNKISNMYTMLHVRIINWITHFCRAHFTIRTVIRIPKLLLSTIIIIFRIQYFLSNFLYSVSERCTSWKVMLLRKIYMKKNVIIVKIHNFLDVKYNQKLQAKKLKDKKEI